MKLEGSVSSSSVKEMEELRLKWDTDESDIIIYRFHYVMIEPHVGN